MVAKIHLDNPSKSSRNALKFSVGILRATPALSAPATCPYSVKLELERGCGDSLCDKYGHFQPSYQGRTLKHLFIGNEEEEGFDCCFVIFFCGGLLIQSRQGYSSEVCSLIHFDPVCHKMRKTKSYFIVGFWYNDEFTIVQQQVVGVGQAYFHAIFFYSRTQGDLMDQHLLSILWLTKTKSCVLFCLWNGIYMVNVCILT